LLLLVLIAGGIGLWFYQTYLAPTQIELAPGVSAVLAGGGNSLIVKDGNDLLVVDTKFPPASDWLRKRIAGRIALPVTMVINTHYHYDHTEGNTNYPNARIYAYKIVPDLMRKRDADWWNAHESGIPKELIDETANLKVGAQEIVVTHPGPGHTQGDLWVYLRRGDKEIVATGDLVFHTYYPFMDLGEGGIDVPGLTNAVRTLAAKYPNAVFLPGHGPLANASDLVQYADYLQFLSDSVAQARQKGFTEDQTVASIDLSQWHLSKLPSFHSGKLCWATAEMNIRWVYQLQTGTRTAREDCTF
jgi:glyoxylase-like metal-dependent hydrolase (beta-lactamase superfamily II)